MRFDLKTAAITTAAIAAIASPFHRYDVVLTGSGASYVLYKNGSFSGRHPVATFWGHVNDAEVCQWAADELNRPIHDGKPGLYDCAAMPRPQFVPN